MSGAASMEKISAKLKEHFANSMETILPTVHEGKLHRILKTRL